LVLLGVTGEAKSADGIAEAAVLDRLFTMVDILTTKVSRNKILGGTMPRDNPGIALVANRRWNMFMQIKHVCVAIHGFVLSDVSRARMLRARNETRTDSS
jgi:hypothetical protein